MSEAVKSNLQLIYRIKEECWNRGNLNAVPELVAEDCAYHDVVFPHLAPGVHSLQRHIERCRRAFPDLKFAITEVSAKEHEAQVRWIASATQAAEFLGVPATNKRASITGRSVYRIEDGKIVEAWVTWDLMSLMAQLGSPAE